jgi:PST family polysaccharide transporter
VVNAVFLVALSALGLVRGFVLAAFLSREDYGIWGILLVGLGTLAWLKQVGIGDKYIQQDEPDQQRAFQKAFTLEAIFTTILSVLLALMLPVLAVVYGRWDIVVPGLVLILVLPAGVLQAPLWVYYRDMDFLRQRVLQAADPIVGLIAAVALAAAGAGYWALILSVVAGSWVAAAIAIRTSPFPLRFVYERGSVRSYAEFSWPLFVASFSSMLTAQAVILLSNWRVGIAAAGSITLAAQVTQFTDRVDQVVTGTLYPAICAAKDRTDVLFESFVKSNRLALMWALPFGLAVTLFAADLVHFALGDEWIPAIGVLEVFGVTAALGQLGFNWDAYFRARGDTRPMAVASALAAVGFFAAGVPLLLSEGIVGIALGISAQVAVLVVCRAVFLARLFDGFAMARHAARSLVPIVPPVALVLGLRALETGSRTEIEAVGELIAFSVTAITATLVLERALVREALGYVRSRRTALAS